jgi:hypothetical protein
MTPEQARREVLELYIRDYVKLYINNGTVTASIKLQIDPNHITASVGVQLRENGGAYYTQAALMAAVQTAIERLTNTVISKYEEMRNLVDKFDETLDTWASEKRSIPA